MSLRSAAISAGRWVSISLIYRAALQALQVLILARVLMPADFGIMAIAVTFYGLVSTFSDMGLSNALIHFPEPPEPQRSALFLLNFSSASLLAGILIVLAWPISRMYHHDALLPVIQLLSLALPLGAAGQQFKALAEKNLRFFQLAWIEVASTTCGFIVAMISAIFDLGVFSLVNSALATAITSSSLAWIYLSNGARPGLRISFDGVGAYVRYGSYRLGESAINTIQNQLDLLIGGLVAASGAMGMYATSRDISLRIANTIVNPIATRIGLPVMARRQHDVGAVRSIYLQVIRLTASINFFVYLTLAMWPAEIIDLVLGHRWIQASPYLRLFAAWGLVRSITNPVGSLLYATGQVRRAFWWNASLLMLTPPLLAIAGWQFGLDGLAWTMLGIQALVFFPAFKYLVQPATDASFSEYLQALVPPLLISVASVTVGHLASRLISPPILRLAIGASFATAVYVVASLKYNRACVSAIFELARPLLPAREHQENLNV
jgi:O-antigen/teichoic acid export membrane protein